MKPGITGLWQVRGRRDPDFDHWVEADLEYIDKWSLWLDVQILFRTIPAALEGRLMALWRRSEPGAPALLPDIAEAFGLGDGPRELQLVGTLAIKKLGAWHLMPDPGRHEITISSHGCRFTLDLWAVEHRPLREIVARDEYEVIASRPSSAAR